MDTKEKSKKKNKKIFRKIIAILILEMIITAATAPLIIFYGPFDQIKTVVVGTLIKTLSHKKYAEFFLSEDAIDRIVDKTNYYKDDKSSGSSTTSGITVSKSHSGKIDSIKIEGSNIHFKGYLLVIHDPTTVKVGYSSKLPIEGELTSNIAKRNKAVAAINAGGFGYDQENWASTGGKIDGFIIHDGKVVRNNLENQSESEPYDCIGIDRTGILIFGQYSINQLREMQVDEATCFYGPKLIVNGKKKFSRNRDGGQGFDPRTAIGQRANGDILFLVVDSLVRSLDGASMYDLQEILYSQGAVNAINLDGGSSTSMFFNGKLINNPSNTFGERTVPSVFMAVPKNGGASN